MHDWVRGRFRTRYKEIATKATDELRERIARHGGPGHRPGRRREGGATSDARGPLELNAVEASMVLRNLSTSKGINLDQEGKLRGRAGVVVDHRGFNELAEALLRLGIAERVVDAEVVEEDPPPALPAVRSRPGSFRERSGRASLGS